MTKWKVPQSLTIHCATGEMDVPCYTSGVDGLIVHPQPGHEQLRTYLWVLAHEPTGLAIAKDFWFLGKGEASRAADGLRLLADWTQPIDPTLPVVLVRAAFEDATAWRSSCSQSVQDLVWHIGDRVIASAVLERCDGTWHRIALGWGFTYISLGTPRRPAGECTVFHLSARREIATEGRVWSHDDDHFMCLDCDLDV